jgi:hypothetical protein
MVTWLGPAERAPRPRVTATEGRLDTATESPAAMPKTPIPRHFGIRKPVLPTFGAPTMNRLLVDLLIAVGLIVAIVWASAVLIGAQAQ